MGVPGLDFQPQVLTELLASADFQQAAGQSSFFRDTWTAWVQLWPLLASGQRAGRQELPVSWSASPLHAEIIVKKKMNKTQAF